MAWATPFIALAAHTVGWAQESDESYIPPLTDQGCSAAQFDTKRAEFLPDAANPGTASAFFEGTFEAPGRNHQNYDVTCLDLPLPGEFGISYPLKLEFRISTGNGESKGSYDVFKVDAPLTPNETVPGRPRALGAITRGSYDVSKGRSSRIRLTIERPMGIVFGATGNWFSRKGSNNTYSVQAVVR
ncbi:MAG: hypothetical protein AAF650_08050 [Pseudomonadota bacterium]